MKIRVAVLLLLLSALASAQFSPTGPVSATVGASPNNQPALASGSFGTVAFQTGASGNGIGLYQCIVPGGCVVQADWSKLGVSSGTVTQSSSAAHNTAIFTSATNVTGVAPTANGQCFMSAASNFGTSDPSFQSCPGTTITGLSSNGTTLTFTGAGGLSLSAANAFIADTEGNAPAGAAGSDLLWGDSTAHRLKMNNNNGGALQIVAAGTDINTSDQVTAAHFAACPLRAYTAGGTVTQYQLVIINSAGQVVTSGTGQTPVMGIAQNSSTVGNPINVCLEGISNVLVDATSTAGDLLIPSTVAGEASDQGAVSRASFGLQAGVIGNVITGSVGAGSTSVVNLDGSDRSGRAILPAYANNGTGASSSTFWLGNNTWGNTLPTLNFTTSITHNNVALQCSDLSDCSNIATLTGAQNLGASKIFTTGFSVTGSTGGTMTAQMIGTGTFNWNWPLSAGTAGMILQSQGGGVNPMTWTATPSLTQLTLSGALSVPAWTTSGVALSVLASTFNDSSSAGTVASMGVSSFGIPTITATSATTYTQAGTVTIAGPPVASTNVTITQPYSLIVTTGKALFLGTQVLSPQFNATAAATTLTVSGGVGTTSSNGAAGALLEQGSDNTSAGAAAVGGSLTARGGDDTGATGTTTGGGVTIRGGNTSSTTAGTAGGAVSVTGGSVTGAATNLPGADVAVAGGLGTGNSAPSHVKIQGPGFLSASGTTAQAQVTRFVAHAKAGSTTSATATSLFNVALAASQTAGVLVTVHIETTQATPHNCSTMMTFLAVAQNTAGTVTQQTTPNGTVGTICDTGTLTATAAFSAAAPAVFSVTPSWTTIVPTAVIITVEIQNLSQQEIALL